MIKNKRNRANQKTSGKKIIENILQRNGSTWTGAKQLVQDSVKERSDIFWGN